MKNAVKIISSVVAALLLLCSCTETGVSTDTAETKAETTEAETTKAETTEAVATDEITTSADTEALEDDTLIKFNNPISINPMPDPFITYHDGYYYGLATEGGQVRLYRSKQVEKIFNEGEYKDLITWGTYIRESAILGANIWAPELTYIPSTGKWYVYSCACIDTWGDFAAMRMFCLESEDDDPFGTYTFKGITLDQGRMQIDQTVYYDEATGNIYTAYSDFVDKGQVIMIADMENPWTVGQTRNMVTFPECYWERRGTNDTNDGRVNEGPVFLKHDGQIFLIYSASGCWSEFYCLGMLRYTGADTSKENFLNPDNWEKSLEPVFVKANNVYGVGHCSFFNSPDGTEVWIAYHGMSTPDGGELHRYAYVQKIDFDENGIPVLGEPILRETAIPVPSGQEDPAEPKTATGTETE